MKYLFVAFSIFAMLLVPGCVKESESPPQQLPAGYAAVISENGNFSAPMMTVSMPVISENYVMWHQFFKGSPHIMLYDLASGKARQLTNESNQLEPCLSGSKIVWLDQADKNDQYGMRIYYYDLKDDTGRFITPQAGGRTAPKIDGDHVVWAEMVNGSKQLILYDLASGTETQITHGNFIPSTYYISGDLVVWGTSHCNMSITKCDVGYGIYDISSKTEDFIEVEEMDKYCYDFKDNSIVYSRWEKPVYVGSEEIVAQIHLYDVLSKTGKKVTDSKSNKMCPRVSGNTIIWWDSRNNGSLYSYNLATNEEKNLQNLTPTGYYQYDISGNKVVFLDVYNSSGVNLLVLGD